MCKSPERDPDSYRGRVSTLAEKSRKMASLCLSPTQLAEQHLPPFTRKNQKNGNLLTTIKEKRTCVTSPGIYPAIGGRAGGISHTKNQKNGKLLATLVHQHTQNQILIKMQNCFFYENPASFRKHFGNTCPRSLLITENYHKIDNKTPGHGVISYIMAGKMPNFALHLVICQFLHSKLNSTSKQIE